MPPDQGDSLKRPALNSATLHARAKFDKKQFIHSYVKSQQTYLTVFASEGQAYWNSSNCPSGEISVEGSGRDHKPHDPQIGFRTPPVKPRVPFGMKYTKKKTNNERQSTRQVQEDEDELPAGGHPSQKNPTASLSDVLEEDISTEEASKRHRTSSIENIKQHKTHNGKCPPKTLIKATHSNKKRPRSSDDDNEHNARLKERCERRRTKRAILNPVASEQSEDSIPSEEQPRKKKRRRGNNGNGKESKGGKLSAGFALMHGFSADNISKNRITLKPSIGVFNKGKASLKTLNRKAKEDKLDTVPFSESQFLNKVRLDGSIFKESPHSSDPESTSTSSFVPSKIKKRSKKIKRYHKPVETKSLQTSNLKGKSPSGSTIMSGERPNSCNADSRQRAIESVVWDIELDDAVRPSGSSPPPVETCQTCRESTIVLNTRHVKWNDNNMGIDAKTSSAGSLSVINEFFPKPQLADNLSNLENIDGGTLEQNTPSLCPSQSVSQIAFRAARAPPNNPISITNASKYFNQSTIKNNKNPNSESPHFSDPIDAPVQRITGGALTVVSSTASSSINSQSWSKCPSITAADMSGQSVRRLSTHPGFDAATEQDALWAELEAMETEDPALRYVSCAGFESPDNESATAEGNICNSVYDYELTWATRSSCYDPLKTKDDLTDVIPLSPFTTQECKEFMDSSEVEVVWEPGVSMEDSITEESEDVNTSEDQDEYDEIISPNSWNMETEETVDGSASFECPHIERGIEMFASEPQSQYSDGDTSVSTTSMNALPQFSQGRALLLGLSEQNTGHQFVVREKCVLSAEGDVARSLRGHWLPQKP